MPLELIKMLLAGFKAGDETIYLNVLLIESVEYKENDKMKITMNSGRTYLVDRVKGGDEDGPTPADSDSK